MTHKKICNMLRRCLHLLHFCGTHDHNTHPDHSTSLHMLGEINSLQEICEYHARVGSKCCNPFKPRRTPHTSGQTPDAHSYNCRICSQACLSSTAACCKACEDACSRACSWSEAFASKSKRPCRHQGPGKRLSLRSLHPSLTGTCSHEVTKCLKTDLLSPASAAAPQAPYRCINI